MEPNCPFCGAEGDSAWWGPRYHSCGTMRDQNIRAEACYETELEALRELERVARLLTFPDTWVMRKEIIEFDTALYNLDRIREAKDD